MVTGILPVVGVPLPLFSYGGSSVLADLLGVGILLNVSLRRFMISARLARCWTRPRSFCIAPWCRLDR